MLKQTAILGTRFNWLILVEHAICRIAYGAGVPFWVDLDAGVNGADIERLLGKRGIPVWGWLFDSDRMCFRVRKRQAGYAWHILSQAGIPLVGVPRGVVPQSQPPGAVATRRQKNGITLFRTQGR